MRKLNWDDEETRAYAVKCLSAVWNMRYNSVHCMANLLAGLAPYHVSRRPRQLVAMKGPSRSFQCVERWRMGTKTRRIRTWLTPEFEILNVWAIVLQEESAVEVIDNVLEDIRVGMEVSQCAGALRWR